LTVDELQNWRVKVGLVGEKIMALDIRAASVEDAATVHGLIRDLAAAQGHGEAMRATVEDIRRDGFGPGALFHSLLAQREGKPMGLALYFYIYSTWQGRPALYVEDLIVDASARGLGVGTELMRALAKIAMARGCSKLELSVSEENTARVFYEGLGMCRKSDWLPYTIDGAALKGLAAGELIPPRAYPG
jgi:GNAT superfamily N-acetyltransferase